MISFNSKKNIGKHLRINDKSNTELVVEDIMFSDDSNDTNEIAAVSTENSALKLRKTKRSNHYNSRNNSRKSSLQSNHEFRVKQAKVKAKTESEVEGNVNFDKQSDKSTWYLPRSQENF